MDDDDWDALLPAGAHAADTTTSKHGKPKHVTKSKPAKTVKHKKDKTNKPGKRNAKADKKAKAKKTTSMNVQKKKNKTEKNDKTKKKAKKDKKEKKDKKDKKAKKDENAKKNKQDKKDAQGVIKKVVGTRHNDGTATKPIAGAGAAFAKSVTKRARRADSPESPQPVSTRLVITVGSDCAGYGSDFIALELLHVGATLVFVAEKDAGKRELLKAAHPTVDFNKTIIYQDVTKRNNDDAPYVDIFCTGAPCQPWSQAGEKQGLEDLQGRGVVLFHSLEYVRCKRPRLVILENVKGLSHQPNKHVLDSILCALKDMGYTVDWKILDTKDHGIPHSRPRLYIVAVRSRHLVRALEFPGRLRGQPVFERFIDIDNKGGCGELRGNKCFQGAMAKASKKHGEKLLQESWVVVDVMASAQYSNSMIGCVPCITKSRGRPSW